MLTIFTLIAAYIVYRALRQALRVYECPSDETLTAFWRGKLRHGSDPHRQLIAHLGTCEKCQERLHILRKGLSLEDHLIDEEA